MISDDTILIVIFIVASIGGITMLIRPLDKQDKDVPKPTEYEED